MRLGAPEVMMCLGLNCVIRALPLRPPSIG